MYPHHMLLSSCLFDVYMDSSDSKNKFASVVLYAFIRFTFSHGLARHRRIDFQHFTLAIAATTEEPRPEFATTTRNRLPVHCPLIFSLSCFRLRGKTECRSWSLQ